MTKISKYKTLWLVLSVIAGTMIVLLLVLPHTSQQTGTRSVGFVLPGLCSEEGWNGIHYAAMQEACEEQGVKLLVKENIPEQTGACEPAVKELADDGAEMIILNSYGYVEEMYEAVKDYPDVTFYGTSSEYHAENMTSYFVRMYQARYLAGIVAGMETENGKIGYVAAMPNNEVNRGISAFTLGVRSVNPEAEVIVAWSGAWDDAEGEIKATNLLVEKEQVDVLTYHQNQDHVVAAADAAGIKTIGYHQYYEGYSENYLTAAVCDWKLLYKHLIQEFQKGEGNATPNYWLGMEEGIVGLSAYSSVVSNESILAVEAAQSEILAGKDVFSGIIYDNEGVIRCNENETISDEVLLEQFDWYVEGVRFYEE